jgi:phosphoglycerate kinase
MSRITEFLPSCAGLVLDREVGVMRKALENPERPFVAIIGGSKISGKIGVLNNLIQKVDHLLLGGAMIFTFYKAEGLEIGESLYEPEKVDLAKLIMNNERLVLPVDVVVADRKDAGAESKTVDRKKIPKGWYGLDIGKKTVDQFKDILKDARTVIWNGPLGLFEVPQFAKGTEDIARFLAELRAKVIIGGGDTDASIKKLGLEDRITHISTGGGASLELLEGKELPAVRALEDNATRF